MHSPTHTHPEVDAYIAEAEPFAQPLLRHFRQLVHAAAPEVEEAIKWNMPFFVLGGRNVCHMAAFKAHCGFGFWEREVAAAVANHVTPKEQAMGQFGRVTRKQDLPPARELTRYLKQAAALARAKSAATPRPAAKPKKAAKGRRAARRR